MRSKFLAIYLNDHLAGATVGATVAQRTAGSNRDSTTYYATLRLLAQEIREDRESLLAIMGGLEIATDQLKQLLAWGAEKASRLKLNGRLRGYSPLSRVDEFEFLALGVTGKLSLWRNLELLAPTEPRLHLDQLTALIARAERQLGHIEKCRAGAVREAFLA
jgi:hypothetical protein